MEAQAVKPAARMNTTKNFIEDTNRISPILLGIYYKKIKK